MSSDFIGKVNELVDKAKKLVDPAVEPANKAFKVADKAKKFADDYQARSHSQKTYPQNLQHRYGKLTIPGLSGCNSIDLLDMFVDQKATEELRIGQSKQEESKSEQEESKSESALDILTKQDHRCVVILGDQGSGKSTLVQYLAVDWARWAAKELKRWGGQKMTIDSYLEASLGLIGQGKTPKQFPILIELKEYINNRIHIGESFREFWHRGIAADRKLSKEKLTELNNKNISVIFDGLNEISDRRLHSDTVRKIIEFANIHPLTKIIVTSRNNSYDGIAFENANFWHFKLKDFDDSQVIEIIDNWCNLTIKKDKSDKKRKSKKTSREKENLSQQTGEQKKERKIEKKERKELLIDRIKQFPSISGKPQFLMMILGILDDKDYLPTEQELYDRLAQMLLASSNENGIDRREKQVILGRIAYEMQFGSHDSDGNSIDYESLKQLLISHLVIKKFKDPNAVAVQTIGELESDRFINCVDKKFNSEDIYNFVKPEFLAYFCAKEVKIRSKTSPSKPLKIFESYWKKETRYESLRSICGALDPKSALELVSFLMDRKVDRAYCLDEKNRATKKAIQHLCLARECLEEIKNYSVIDSKINENLKEKLKSEIKPDNSLNREAAKKLTDSIAKYYRESSTLKWLENIALTSDDRYVRSAAVESIADYYHYRSDDSIPKLLQKVATQDHNVAPKDPDALAQQSAIQSIAKYYHTKKDLKLELWQGSRWSARDSKKYNLLAWLKDCFDLATHRLVQRESVRAIAKYYHHIPDTLEWLRDYAMQDYLEQDVRASAVKELASYYHKEPNTLKLLGCALDNEYQNVRQEAVRAIAKHYRIEESEPLIWSKDFAIDNPHPLIYLRDCALGRKNPDVRRVAIESIAKYHRDRKALTFLRTIVENNDEDGSIQAIAVSAIAKYYRQEHDIFNRREHDIFNHQEPDILKWLKGYDIFNHQEPDILKWLKYHATNDENKLEVRGAALQSISWHYDREPNILKWLQSSFDSLHYYPKKARKIVVESIAKYHYKDPDTLGWLQNTAFKDSEANSRLVIVGSIAKYHYKDADTLGWLQNTAFKDSEANVRLAVVESIVKYYREDADTLAWIKDTAFKDSEANIRLVIVGSIVKYYHKDADTLGWLQNTAFTDSKANVRRVAVESIVNYYHKDADTLTWLQNTAFTDSEANVRLAVVESIVKYYREDADTLAWIKDTAFKDSEANIQLVIVESIVKYYREDANVSAWIKDTAFKDSEANVRLVIVESIVKYYREDADTLTWLQNTAFKDSKANIRLAVVESIAKYYHKNPKILAWIKDIAFEDSEVNIRLFAVESIAKYYHEDADTLTWLQNTAFKDSKANIRLAVVESIAKYCHEDADTLTWLQNTAFKDSKANIRLAMVESIAKYCHKNPKILAWIKDIASEDSEVNIRLFAVESIAKYYHKDPYTLSWLKKIAFTNFASPDKEADVRQVAKKSILKYYYQKNSGILDWIQDFDNPLYSVGLLDVEHAVARSISKPYYQAETGVKSLIQHVVSSPHLPLNPFESIKKSWDIFDLSLLKELVLNNPDPKIKLAAIEKIAKHYRNEDRAWKWFEGIAERYDIDLDVRLLAIKSIAKYYHNYSKKDNPKQLNNSEWIKYPNTLKWLEYLTKKADDSNVRRLAVESIAKYYYKKKKESNPIDWLKECVLDSEDEVVWRAALESIPKHYKYYNEKTYRTLQWLKGLALNQEFVWKLAQSPKYLALNNERDRLKRSAALQSIAKCYWDEPKTLKWLRAIAQCKGDYKIKEILMSLRVDAVKSIAQYYHKKPDTLIWLQERFLYEEHNPEIRAAIIESISKYYRKKSFIFTLLKESALNDYEPLVRSASIQAINEYFPKNNEVNNILQLVIDRDLDRNIDDEDYPKAVAVKILKDRYR